MMSKKDGCTKEFDLNWREREETYYNHWRKGNPKNQIQLAFNMHWEIFNQIMGDAAEKKGKGLEVGCGRGSMSSFFADNGWDVTLLDSSSSVIDVAKQIFNKNGHNADFVVGDANSLEFRDSTFDVVYSIGLLEHFEDVYRPIFEQWRVLKPGGWFLGYIVPENPDNIQRYFSWFNKILHFISSLFAGGKENAPAKEPIFRSTFDSRHYLNAIKELKVDNLLIKGMYPLPMISHSPEFPFSLMPSAAESVLTKIFEFTLSIRHMMTGRHGWLCSEKMGQAFLLAFQKPMK